MNKISMPVYENIPDVGLYLEQITKYINQTLPSDISLTPTMITNYVKLQIVPKGIKKMYSRQQIAMFIIIAYTKSVLSLEQIRILFNHYEIVKDVEKFYNLFTDSLNNKKVNDSLICSLSLQIINKISLDNQIWSIDKIDNNVKIDTKSKEEKN